MADIFDNTILCNKCEVKMRKAEVSKNGFILRAVACPHCKSVVIHPSDEQEYNKFIDLKNKDFRVKMRVVGNSYTVSIPKEIVSFIREQEKIMDDMVRLCFEDFGRLSLNFGKMNEPLNNEVRKEDLSNLNEIRRRKIN
jgi:Zn-finger nucleic acid-binding protein